MNIKISHKKVQSIPKGPLGKTTKTQGSKKLFTHPPIQPTNTSQTVNRGQKDLKLVSDQVLRPASHKILGEYAEVVHKGTI